MLDKSARITATICMGVASLYLYLHLCELKAKMQYQSDCSIIKTDMGYSAIVKHIFALCFFNTHSLQYKLTAGHQPLSDQWPIKVGFSTKASHFIFYYTCTALLNQVIMKMLNKPLYSQKHLGGHSCKLHPTYTSPDLLQQGGLVTPEAI